MCTERQDLLKWTQTVKKNTSLFFPVTTVSSSKTSFPHIWTAESLIINPVWKNNYNWSNRGRQIILGLFDRTTLNRNPSGNYDIAWPSKEVGNKTTHFNATLINRWWNMAVSGHLTEWKLGVSLTVSLIEGCLSSCILIEIGVGHSARLWASDFDFHFDLDNFQPTGNFGELDNWGLTSNC